MLSGGLNWPTWEREGSGIRAEGVSGQGAPDRPYDGRDGMGCLRGAHPAERAGGDLLPRGRRSDRRASPGRVRAAVPAWAEVAIARSNEHVIELSGGPDDLRTIQAFPPTLTPAV